MKQTERRRFFRIVDAISIRYSEKTNSSPEDEETNSSDILSEYNQTLTSLIEKLESSSPDMAEAISTLNKKMDLFFRLSELDGNQMMGEMLDIEEASLSACGIGFPVREHYEVGTELHLMLHLHTSKNMVESDGKVVSCQPLGKDDQNYLRVEFTNMSHQGREQLIQHIIQRQGALIKNLKSLDEE